MTHASQLNISIATYEMIDIQSAIAWARWWYEFAMQHLGGNRAEVQWFIKLVNLHDKGKKKKPLPLAKIDLDKFVKKNESGSRGPLLTPRPLRTARESFPSSRSSLSNVLYRTRLYHRYLLAMDLHVAIWM